MNRFDSNFPENMPANIAGEKQARDEWICVFTVQGRQ
jgi:hypothetical protein